MRQPNNQRKPLTATELMERLERDPQYVARREQADAQWHQAVEQNKLAAKPVIEDLKDAGFAIQSLDELRRSGIKYKAAIPVLLKWLPLMENVDIKEAIVRTLSVPWAKPAAAYPLIAEFRAMSEPASGLKWTIGNALAVVADDRVFNEIAELVRDKRHGKAREMLAVALGNMHDPRAVDLLLELLRDDEVVGHALTALGKLKAQKARPQVDSLLNHPKPWVRKEAQRTMAKLDKCQGQTGPPTT